jgi:hypothetical protein
LNAATRATTDAVDLVFVTDEIPLPTEGGKVVCDRLALRRDAGRSTPVLIELKDSRMLTRLVDQVEAYSALMNEHAEAFEKLYSAILGEPVRFDGPAEKWIVWPASSCDVDTKEALLAARGVRVVGYRLEECAFTFVVGPAPM